LLYRNYMERAGRKSGCYFTEDRKWEGSFQIGKSADSNKK